MALTGQLSDLSLAELIEFFCNQRKTGRLKVDYHRGHGVFFMKDGQLVDAKVGALSGAEAVYFALTLPNAAFDFSADFQPPRRTISVTWTQVVLEGLRRLDEGVSPSEAEAFSAEELSAVEAASPQSNATGRNGKSATGKDEKDDAASAVPLSLLVDGASGGGAGRSRMVMGIIIGCALLACAAAAIPLAGRFSKSRASASLPEVAPAAVSAQPEAAPSNVSGDTQGDSATEAVNAEAGQAADAAAADEAAAAARREARERETRLREARERERRAEEAAKKVADGSEKSATPAAVASGPKSVRVSVSYDEAGRVTQASVAGASPGGEAYAATAVRIARGRRFPAGKAGSTVVTIPFN